MRYAITLVTAAAALGLAAGQAEAQLTRLGAGAAGSVGGAVSGTLPGAADAAIGGRLQSRLQGQLHLSGVQSEVSHGVARLRGTVATQADKRRAARIARRIDGVTRVRNEISVQARGGTEAQARHSHRKATADASLGAAVKSNIDASGSLAQRGIHVEQTKQGTVRLSGEVASKAEKQLAGHVAANTRAVADVDNDIVVHRTGDSGNDDKQ